ncbi:heavy-metal-associated domain-containing protein [Candidatus Poribacteria bacterium]|nr:heavy-metal-associated domain-containing protein [Candidatus Poribacteria bacterium]
MQKIRIEIQGMSCEHCVKTVTDALTKLDGVYKAKVNLKKKQAIVNYDESCVNLKDLNESIRVAGFEVINKSMKNVLLLLATSISIVIGITGCSDVPYSGPILSVDNVDTYLDNSGADTVCLQDGFDTVCLRVEETVEDDTASIPIIDIYPESIVYQFYYDNNPILEAERTMDTAELVQELIDSGKLNLPPGSTAPAVGNIAKVSDGWTIKIYYPESFPEANRGITLETSGLDIRVATGFQPTIKKGQGLGLNYFRQRDKQDGSRIAEFSVITEEKRITVQVDGLVEGFIIRFYIDIDGVATDEGNTFQLEPK